MFPCPIGVFLCLYVSLCAAKKKFFPRRGGRGGRGGWRGGGWRGGGEIAEHALELDPKNFMPLEIRLPRRLNICCLPLASVAVYSSKVRFGS